MKKILNVNNKLIIGLKNSIRISWRYI